MSNTRTQWNPLRELNAFSRQFDRMFRDAVSGQAPSPFRVPTDPAVNVTSTEDEIVLTAELPGLDVERLDITVVRDSVVIRGERVATELGEDEQWIRRERERGSFERIVQLPFEVDTQSADATYEQGVLRLVLHRPEELKPRKVTVRTA